MRISEHFALSMKQPSLDFLDVDIANDVRLFIDPRAFLIMPSEWGTECIALIKDFFTALLDSIKQNNDSRGLYLLRNLREPNETRLGLSSEGMRGRAVGEEKAEDLWDALSRSEAVQTGLVEDLEDTSLMVPGIGRDVVSDITTNIVREALIEYTQAVCNHYAIPLQADIPSGPLWNPRTGQWESSFVKLPVINDKKLLLVPKVIVRYTMTYEPDEYYRNYLLEELAQEELDNNSGLVKILKNGSRRVTKKDLMAKYGSGKSVLAEQTLRHPNALRRYRHDKRMPNSPLDHIELCRDPNQDVPDWDGLLRAVITLEPGREDATLYEKAIENLLHALFYPSLATPVTQYPIHEGRKRIDIRFTNTATEGFFYWLALHYRAPYIWVECKNYLQEVGNPELDQLSSRFSPTRGECGLLLCRSFDNKDLFLRRCRDTAVDHRGFIVPLDDSDLSRLVDERRNLPDALPEFQLLKDRFDRLIM